MSQYQTQSFNLEVNGDFKGKELFLYQLNGPKLDADWGLVG